MNISLISSKSHSNIQFKGNTNPKAVLAKRQEVQKELNISTGTGYVAKLLRERKDPKLNEFWDNLWKNLKDFIPFANTVEKLELLKTYGISILSYTEEEIARFLKFLKSEPTDKDVYFLQTAMDIARRGQIKTIEEGKEHFLFHDFEPTLEYVLSSKKNKVDFARWNKEHVETHIDAVMSTRRNNGIKTTTEDANNLIAAIHSLLSGKYEGYAFYGKHKYLPISIQSSIDNNKHINIGGIKDYNNSEITIGLSVEKLDFYKYDNLVPPTKKQLFVLLDKDNRLSKLKLHIYQSKDNQLCDDYKYFKEQYEKCKNKQIFINSYDSPLKDRLPNWIVYGLDNSKYLLKTIEYNADTKTAELKHYFGGSVHYPQKFRLVDSSSEPLGIMTDENNSISFIPIEPTAYDLQQMINNEKTNNLLKVLDFSGWKEPFMKIVSESLKA